MANNATAYDEEVIQEYQKFFDFYIKLPKIITIILAVLGGISGLIAASGDFGWVLAIWAGTAFVCFLTYAILKPVYSYYMLKIYYLKKIANDKNITPPDESVYMPEELPNI